MFEVNKKVVTIGDFEEVRRLYNYPYPKRGDILVVQGITVHPKPKWVMLHFAGYILGLCSVNFAPLEEISETMFEEVLEEILEPRCIDKGILIITK